MIRRRLRTALVAAMVVLLAGCALEAPERKPAAPAAEAAAAPEAGGLCEHGVPGALCTQCDPELAEVFKETGDWCSQHGVPESQCFKCNPDLEFDAATVEPADWCNEHSLPESKCTKCSPDKIAGFIEAGNYCREHGFPESVCPICHPELVRAAGRTPPAEAPLKTKIRLASARTVEDAGIETTQIELRRVASDLQVVGQLEYDQNHLAQLSSRGEAVVRAVKVDIGDEVSEGQALAELASASVGEGQAQLIGARAQLKSAKATFERESSLARKGISPRQSAEEAQAALAQAQADYDSVSAGLRIAGGASGNAEGIYSLHAPFPGTVVARHAVVGRMVPSNEVLVEIADLSTIWATLELPEAEAPKVKPGQKVAIEIEGTTLEPLQANVSRIGSAVDESTRTVQARVELPNHDRSLKAGAFIRATIETSAAREALIVPRVSVQTAEGRSLVFVRKEESLFVPVTVQVGASHGDKVEITGGLRPGAEVVTTGAFLLKTEISKESIGAGCCEEDE